MDAPFAVEFGGHALWLLPQRAAYLPEHATLLVADAHIGKAVSFRRLGVPVPAGTTGETLGLLDHCLAATGARRLVFLGDLLHSRRALAAGTLAEVQRWRERWPALELTLVRGNHDHHAGDPPAALQVQCVDEPLPLRGLRLCHHPQAIEGATVLAGHRHPCITLGGRAHDRLHLPCFHFAAGLGVLPAFGAFTGMHPVQRAPGDRVFAAAGDRVIEVAGPYTAGP